MFENLWVCSNLKNLSLEELLLLLFLIDREFRILQTKEIIDSLYISLDFRLHMDQRKCRRNLKIISEGFNLSIIIIWPDNPLNLADFAFGIWLKFSHVQSLVILTVWSGTCINIYKRVDIVNALEVLKELILLLWKILLWRFYNWVLALKQMLFALWGQYRVLSLVH